MRPDRQLHRFGCSWPLAQHPVVNRALVIRGRRDAGVTLELNDETVPRGPSFRYGRRRTPARTDLIVWLQARAEKPIALKLTPAGR